MDFRTMSDSELASVMVNYINRVSHLQDIIGRYLEGYDNISAEQIQKCYTELKNEIHKDAHYLGLVRNHDGSSLYMGAFSPSIREASAFGFTTPINSGINQSMYSSVEEAHYKLTKYYTLEEWGSLM